MSSSDNKQMELPGLGKSRNVMTIDKSMKLVLAMQKWMETNKTNKISQAEMTKLCKTTCGFLPQIRSVRTIMQNVGLSFTRSGKQREFKGRTSEGVGVVLAKIMFVLVEELRTASNENSNPDSQVLWTISEALQVITSHQSVDKALQVLKGE